MPITEPDLIQVAVGIALDEKGRVLVGQRPPDKDYAGQWEFPGGKLEPGEDVFEALVREFKEELNLFVQAAQPLFFLSPRLSRSIGEPASLAGHPVLG